MKTFLTIMILMIFGAAAQGQTAYKGLTPGKSTKADVDRILGAPVKTVSPVLVEYAPQPISTKIYVQFNSASNVVERIEVLCKLASSNCLDFARANKLNVSVPDSPTVSTNTYKKATEKMVVSFGAPSYLAVTYEDDYSFAGTGPIPVRVAFYSPDLHRAAAELNAAIEANCGSDTPPKEYDEPNGALATLEGCVQVKRGDGPLMPASRATIEVYRTDLTTVPQHFSFKTDRRGAFRHYLTLSPTGSYVIVFSGPGLKWTAIKHGRLQTLSFVKAVLEPGDGIMPTYEQALHAGAR